MSRRARSEVHWDDMAEIPYRSSRVMKTLGNPKTYALASLLLQEEVLNVGEMCAALRRSYVAVSKMLRSLRELDIVRYQKEQGFTVYTLKDPAALRDLLHSGERLAERAGKKAS